MDNRPLIAVPIGDPAGIGPEIVAKALADSTTEGCARVVVVGDAAVMERAIKTTKAPLKINRISEPDEGKWDSGIMNIIENAQYRPLPMCVDYIYIQIALFL